MKNPLAIVVALILIALGGLLYVNGDRWDRWGKSEEAQPQQAAAPKPGQESSGNAAGMDSSQVKGAAGTDSAADSSASGTTGQAAPAAEGTASEPGSDTAQTAAGTGSSQSADGKDQADVPAASSGSAGQTANGAGSGILTEGVPAGATAEAEDDGETPSFDIVRIEEDGTAVVAGRSKPMARVKIMLGEEVIGETEANDRGEWVIVLDKPIAPGNHSLSAEATVEGQAPVKSKQVLALALPERGQERPLIVATEPGQASRVLQKPESAEGAAKAVDLALEKVDYTSSGAMTFAGQGDPGAKVRFYIDNDHVADADIDAEGNWLLEFAGKIAPGVHLLRVDQLTAEGKVAKRIELPFERAEEAMIAALFGNEAAEKGEALGGDAAKGAESAAVAPEAPATADSGATPAPGTAVTDAGGAAMGTQTTGEQVAEPAAAPAGRGPITQERAAGQVAKSLDRLGGEDEASTPGVAPAATVTAEAGADKAGTASGAEGAATASTTAASDAGGQGGAMPQAAAAADASGTARAGAQADRQASGTVEPAEQQVAAAGTGDAATQPSGQQVATPTSGQPSRELAPEERAVVTAHRDGRVIIQPGNNLWRIARVIYGRGIQYSVIYQANKDQIRDPHKIYPGQIFTTPGVVAPERISPKQRKPLHQQQDPS